MTEHADKWMGGKVVGIRRLPWENEPRGGK